MKTNYFDYVEHRKFLSGLIRGANRLGYSDIQLLGIQKLNRLCFDNPEHNDRFDRQPLWREKQQTTKNAKCDDIRAKTGEFFEILHSRPKV